ncbi:MAG: GAF domain-containing protein [Nitrospinae bacterium]|nr:GAF domain-containing protein [Nitrospinota bacterium]
MDDKLQKVNFLGQYLAASRSEEQILEMAILISHDVLGYDHAIIRLLKGDELVSRISIGFPREAEDLIIHLDEGISGEAARTGKSILVEDTLKDHRFIKGVENCRSELCVPLKYNEKTIGIFNVESEQPAFFSETDLRLLETLASQIAVSLETERLREELNRAEKLSVVGSMASSILHDIRNDIHQLHIASDLLRKPDMPADRAAKVAELVRKAGDNIYGLIEDIFDFVKTGHAKLFRTSTDLRYALEGVVEQVRSFAEPNVEILFDAEPGIEISMDQRRFRRVLLNLCRNAVEAMPNGGTLVISAARSSGGVVLKVADTGVGIDRQNLAKIWEPLFTHGKKEGTGLGMAIVKQIVEDHNWKIDVDSEPGKGTEFTIFMS